MTVEVFEVFDDTAGLLVMDSILEVVHTDVDFRIGNIFTLFMDTLKARGAFCMQGKSSWHYKCLVVLQLKEIGQGIVVVDLHIVTII